MHTTKSFAQWHRNIEDRYRSTYPSRLLRRSVVSSEKLIHRHVESGRTVAVLTIHRTGVVDLHKWIEHGPTISRHYDRIMIVIQWGGTEKGWWLPISNHVYTRNRRSHFAPLQLWSRDDKSRFPFDHRIERLRDRRTDNRRGKPRALVIYI